MCLISVRKEEEHDLPYRRRERVRYSSERIAVSPRHSKPVVIPLQPAQPAYPTIPPPQPAPVFVEPPKPKPPPAVAPKPIAPPPAQYVEVSPRNSSEDERPHRHHDHYYRREVRYREDSPEDDRYEFRYINAPHPPELPRRHRSVSRRRSRSRSRTRHNDYYEDDLHIKIKKNTREYD